MGPKGQCQNQTPKSVKMIYSQLSRLHSTIQEINKFIHVDVHFCLTTQAENLHVVIHFKDEFPTVLNLARNPGKSVNESIKWITNWAAYYFTHPVPETTIALK